VVTSSVKTVETRGRPRLRTDDEILRAALVAFAEYGYTGMSLRTLNTELGLSRGTVNQRFESKEQLWYAAVDHGFQALIDDVNAELNANESPADDEDQLREFVRAFLRASMCRPELVRLMNQEGLHSTERLDHIVSNFVLPTMKGPLQALERLAAAGRARRVPARTLLFLVAHGAAAPFTLGPLSDRFDAIDGPLDPTEHVDLITDVIISGFSAPASAD
jgi:AcrR family transcriptional regulator